MTETRYLKPGKSTNVFNELVAKLTKMGVSILAAGC